MRANANAPLTDRITTVTSADFDLRILQGQGPIAGGIHVVRLCLLPETRTSATGSCGS